MVPMAIASADAEHEPQRDQPESIIIPESCGGVDSATLGLVEREGVPEDARQRRPGDAA